METYGTNDEQKEPRDGQRFIYRLRDNDSIDKLTMREYYQKTILNLSK